MSEWQRIADLFDFEKGSLQSSKCTPGEFTFITAAEEWKTHNEFTHDCEALIFAMGASGSLGRTHYFKGKFISSDLCFILQPKKHLKLDLTFYYYIFNFLRAEIVSKLAKGTSKLAINQKSFGDYKLPYFDYDHQLFFREKMIKIGGITSDIGKEFEGQLSFLKQLRQAVLQEAAEGKLTAEWRKQHPVLKGNPQFDATALLTQMKAEKERLVREGKNRKERSLPPVADDGKPFDLPDGWVWCRLGEVADGFQYGSSAKSQKEGKIPVLRMGNIQGGKIDWTDLVFTNDEDEAKKYRLTEGDLLFNRTNSRELVGKTGLFNGRHEAIFAGYLVRVSMLGKISPPYSNFVLNSKLHREWCDENKTDALGQSNINATKLRDFLFPLPSLAEQQAIVARVDSLMVVIDELEKQVAERKEQAQLLMQTVLREAFDGN